VKTDPPATIRGAQPDDVREILRIYTPFVTDTVVSFEEQAPSLDEMANRIANSHVWLVAEVDAQVVGYAYAAPFRSRPAYRWSAEVSVYLLEGAQGQGLGRQLIESLLEALTTRGLINVF